MKRVKARADAVSRQVSRNGVETWLRGMERCTVIQGHARFSGPHEIDVGGEVLTAPRIFINVGGRARMPDMPGVRRRRRLLTNSSMLALDTLPRHLVVVGGSYVGLEFAQMYRRFGAEVTVVEKGAAAHRARGRGRLATRCARSSRRKASPCGSMPNASASRRAAATSRSASHCTEGPEEVVGSHVLLAVGRRPNTDDLGLDKAGVATDERGYIKVDDGLATNVAGIWALGDCNGRGAFTHTAYNDFEIVAANLLDGASRRVSDRIPGYALYIDPPLGRVGMTEARGAQERPHRILVGKRPMTRVSRAVEKGETQGFMKVVADAETKQILGAAILGTGGDEAIHGILDAINAGTLYPTLQWAVPIHPTVSELIPTLLGDMKPPA